MQLNEMIETNTAVTYSGTLQNYLAETEFNDAELQRTLSFISAKHPQAHIAVDFRTSISADSVSNQIIRYKDVFKLPQDALAVPYIIYEEDKALLLLPKEEGSYLYAKGIYYCLTEKGAPFTEYKNNILALSGLEPERISELYDRLFTENAGSLQRKTDRAVFRTYDDLKALAVKTSDDLHNRAPEELTAVQERKDIVTKYVLCWFLLKKVLYVQYMVNKKFLTEVHDGNIHKQRNQARLHANDISFYSYAEMFRMEKDTNL